MDGLLRTQLEDEVEQHDIFIKASESWSKQYEKAPSAHAILIRNEAKYQRALRALFRDTSKKIEGYIDWNEYARQLSQVTAHRIDAKFSVKTIVSGDLFDGFDKDFVKVSFDSIATAIATGAQAGEDIYKIPLGIQSTDSIIQSLTTDRIAWLVGKRVDNSGAIVDNPNADYSITDSVRDDIAKSIQSSLNNGEDRTDMLARLQDTIINPQRAATVAQTESVNAYSSGLLEFGNQSGAVGKEWQDVDAIDVCGSYADEGIVDIEHVYDGDVDAPAAHPNCRCGLRLVYQAEMDDNNNDNPDDNTDNNTQ